MADTKLELNWDIEDGKIVCSLYAGDEELEVASLPLDREEILEAFAEDFNEAVETNDEDALIDWGLFTESMTELTGTINAALEAMRAQKALYRKRLLDEGVDWTCEHSIGG